MAYSIIIKNGLIFDGTAGSLKQADIGIEDEKIKKIGDLKKDQAPVIIDATNKCVSPGFIDLTTHSDTHWTLISQPTQESFIRQGITTILGGHGGSSLAPLVKAEDIETIQKWVDVSKINISWQSMAEFLSELERHQISLNFGTLIGYGTIRRGIMGNQNRAANAEEIAQMQLFIKKSLAEGAFGISMNLGAAHQKSAADEEIIAILKTVAETGALASHHLADEGKNILPAIARLIFLSRSSGSRTHIAHFKGVGKSAWEYFPQGLEMMEQAHKENLLLTCDFFPYTRTGSNLYSLLPEWARESGKKNILNLLKGKERKDIIEYLEDLTLHYEKIVVASTLHDLDVKGKSILEISQSSGLSPEETVLNLLEVNKLQISIFNEAISEDNIELLAKKDYSVVSSDGVGYAGNFRSESDLPHPRSFGAFPRFFSRFVREKSALKIEDALYKMTALPAKILGIKNRGFLAEGVYADIVIFNPETMADKADYINPYQFPVGIEYVLINGAITLKENSFTGLGKGRVLRRS